jgi:PIN domain nuclease of toxin-antitoxin system
MAKVVLDSSAIIALLREEVGAETVAQALDGARLCTVNLSEIVGKMAELGLPVDAVGQMMADLAVQVVDADEDLAWRAGALRPTTREAGLSLGDRFCLALAQREGARVLTADRAWAGLDLDVEVVLIR